MAVFQGGNLFPLPYSTSEQLAAPILLHHATSVVQQEPSLCAVVVSQPAHGIFAIAQQCTQ
eukprot:5736593-Amphidinium_carterae.1